jgi:ABC-type molybdate transport system permease subunit
MTEVLWLTIKLAGITTILLLVLATPLAWWLARGRSKLCGTPVTGLVALPIVLPPTVLGFYLLIALGPKSPLMALLHPFGIRTLAFTFEGLVIGSLIYSLPFAVQPLRNAFLSHRRRAAGGRRLPGRLAVAELLARGPAAGPARAMSPPPSWSSPTRSASSAW